MEVNSFVLVDLLSFIPNKTICYKIQSIRWKKLVYKIIFHNKSMIWIIVKINLEIYLLTIRLTLLVLSLKKLLKASLTFIGFIKEITQSRLSMLCRKGEFGNNINPQVLHQFLVFQLLLSQANRKKLYLVLPDRVQMWRICLTKMIL